MSLITYPVATDPRAFLPRSVSLAQDVNARSFASPFGGSEQAVDMLNDRWRLSMELPPCTQPDAAKREAFINALRGQVNHTELHHFGRPYPQGTLSSCQGLVYDAPQGADSITIATTAGATLLAGDMLGVDGLLLQCRADCTADANGVLVVPLTNRLRRAINGLRRASTATYVDGSGALQTAGVDVPRFQGGQLLVEGAGTNLVPRSQEFDFAQWSKTASTISANATEAPDGTMTADKLVETTAASGHYVMLTLSSVAASVGATFSWSVFAKSAERSYLQLITTGIGPGGGNLVAGFDLASGSAGVPRTGVTSSIQALADGWFRCSMTLTASTAQASTSWQIRLSLTSTDVLSAYTGDGVSGLFIWGADLKAGPLSSYIPTTTAAATRAADVLAPVVWQKPTAPFRLVGRPALRYVPGYSESLALDFVEKVD